ncbi:hypothetical protein Poli38472_009350 [Pythium oligandrum]|uniref:Uncharacterized protein n=1 Tax=Pythium oligandrum TaxID=41045 RepID=A0A8K1CMT3_PYTOL|nr:hypothetical protein Poli38472_009350 [Pythium oligandrum]|eukprot:TMW65183.1 hypothetical protein Poli38472_009350 [Pythium oligandrum]
MTMTLDRDDLFAAAASGDVATIERFFHQPANQPAINRVNRLLREDCDAALARNESPFSMGQPRTPDEWYYRPSATRAYMFDRLFDEPAIRGHVQVFAWFCGATATTVIGDTIRSLIRLMYLSVLKNRTLHEELADVILSSLLFHSMNPLEQKHVFTMMLKAAIVYGRPENLEAVASSGGVWILHPFVVKAATTSKYEAPEFMIRQGMDAQAEITEQGFVDVNARSLDGVTPLMKAAGPGPSKWGKNGLETLFTVHMAMFWQHYWLTALIPMPKTTTGPPLHVTPERVKLAHYEDRLEMMLADKAGVSPYDPLIRTERGQSFVEAHPEFFKPGC